MKKMDLVDIQAVESKLSDVTVTPIPRSQIQNFYHYKQQMQPEQEPRIQISPIHHSDDYLRQKSAANLSSNSSSSAAYQMAALSGLNMGSGLSISSGSNSNPNGPSKYAQLLEVIEEMGRDIRPTYQGSRTSTERLKRAIVHARILVRECLMETDRSARQ
ncbi:CDK2AP1 family protein [Megaselia abdita]